MADLEALIEQMAERVATAQEQMVAANMTRESQAVALAHLSRAMLDLADAQTKLSPPTPPPMPGGGAFGGGAAPQGQGDPR